MTSTTCGSSVWSPHTRTQVQLGDPEDVFGESLSRGITVTREAGKNASAESSGRPYAAEVSLPFPRMTRDVNASSR